MKGIAVLTVVTPVLLEESLVDWIFDHVEDPVFFSGPVNGYSAIQATLTIGEQVSGRKKYIRFEVPVPEKQMEEIVAKLRVDFPDPAIWYWVVAPGSSGNLLS